MRSLVPELLAAAEAARDRPSDSHAQRKLAEAMEKVVKPLEQVLEEQSTAAEQAATLADAVTEGVRFSNS